MKAGKNLKKIISRPTPIPKAKPSPKPAPKKAPAPKKSAPKKAPAPKKATITDALFNLPSNVGDLIAKQREENDPKLFYSRWTKSLPKNFGEGKVRDAVKWSLDKMGYKIPRGLFSKGRTAFGGYMAVIEGLPKDKQKEFKKNMTEWGSLISKSKETGKSSKQSKQLDERDTYMPVGSYVYQSALSGYRKRDGYVGEVIQHTDKGIKIKGFKLRHTIIWGKKGEAMVPFPKDDIYNTQHIHREGKTMFNNSPDSLKPKTMSIPFNRLDRGQVSGGKKEYDKYVSANERSKTGDNPYQSKFS